MLSSVSAQGHRLAGRLATQQLLVPSVVPQTILPKARILQAAVPGAEQQVRFATKKAGGSSNNGRDSAGRRLGIKLFPGLQAKPGSIIVRQRGRKFYAGDNVGMGKDHTIFSKVEGIVKFTRHETKRKRNVVHVLEAGT